MNDTNLERAHGARMNFQKSRRKLTENSKNLTLYRRYQKCSNSRSVVAHVPKLRSHRKPSGSQRLGRVAALNEANGVRDIEERRAAEVGGAEGEVCMEKTRSICIPCAAAAGRWNRARV